MTWLDMGTYWYNPHLEPTDVYDEKGKYVGTHYCPYIPKSICPNNPNPESAMSDTEKGLYNKYIVERVDGSSAPGEKHHECDYYVLDMVHDKFARDALTAYVNKCEKEYPLLAKDLREKYNLPEPLEPVGGNVLPAIGTPILIHLNSIDEWVEHTVTGYYVWGDLKGSESLHRVFIRCIDENGTHNSRMLKDIRYPSK